METDHMETWQHKGFQKPGPKVKTEDARFWPKVNKHGPICVPMKTRCWVWTGGTSRGYGQFAIKRDGKWCMFGAHVWSFTQRKKIQTGYELDHLCRNRACVRPAHLEPVTTAVNHKRGDGFGLAGRLQAAKTHCPKGHPYTGDNLYLTPGTRWRQCRTCIARRSKQQAKKKRKAVQKQKRVGY